MLYTFKNYQQFFSSVSNDTAVKQNTERERPLNEWIISSPTWWTKRLFYFIFSYRYNYLYTENFIAKKTFLLGLLMTVHVPTICPVFCCS